MLTNLLFFLGLVLFLILLRWLYAMGHPRKKIIIKTNGKIIQRRRKWLTLKPRDIINIEPIKGAGHYNIEFVVPPNIGLVTFHIQCFMEGPDKYILKSNMGEYFGTPA